MRVERVAALALSLVLPAGFADAANVLNRPGFAGGCLGQILPIM